jgi:hypothetical protein
MIIAATALPDGQERARSSGSEIVCPVNRGRLFSAAQLRTRVDLIRVGTPVEIPLLRDGRSTFGRS